MSDAALSLNAGNELDPETLFDHPEPGEIPELAEPVMLFTTLENQFLDLSNIYDDLCRAGGMSKALAMEAERALPGVLGAPMAHFSEAPSATRFRISMEEISKGMWALIAAGVAAVVALIVKIIGWFSGSKEEKAGGGGSSDATKAVDKKVEEVKENQEKLKEVTDIAKDAQQALKSNPIVYHSASGHEIKYNSMDDVIAELMVDKDRYGMVRKFLEDPNPIVSDIVYNGPYTQMFEEFAGWHFFQHVTQMMKDKIKELKAVQTSDGLSGGKITPDLESRLNVLIQPVKMDILAIGYNATLKDVVKAFHDKRHKVMTDKKSIKKIRFDDLFNRIEKANKTDYLIKAFEALKGSLEVIGDMKKELEDFSTWMGDLTFDGTADGNSQGLAMKMRLAIPVIGNDLASLQAIAAEMDHFTYAHNSLVLQAEGLTKELVRKLSKEMKQAGVEPPKAWDGVVQKVRSMRKEVGMHFWFRKDK